MVIELGPEAQARGRAAGWVDRAVGGALGVPAPFRYAVRRGVRIPMRDGVELVADHFAPAATGRGTVLIRTPYGRSSFDALLSARVFAGQGFHVLLQSCRGTFGSGGAFEPFRHEIDDGHDTVAWLREQLWFDGRLVTTGASYLGFVQWALLTDPPPELRAAVVTVGLHDEHESTWGTGTFALEDSLGWSDLVTHQEEGGAFTALARQLSVKRRLAPGQHGLPLLLAGEQVLGGQAPWYGQWLRTPDGDDPFWGPLRLGAALDHAQVPVLLVAGWQDLFLGQTLAQYARLRAAGADVALTVGPWTHVQTVVKGARRVVRESLDWFAAHLDDQPLSRPAPVRVYVTGAGRTGPGWRGYPEWPPPTRSDVWYLQPGGGLGQSPPREGAPPSRFTYDPADPTPSVGGRTLSPGSSGRRDNRALEARPDVLSFTGPALAEALEVAGRPVVELAHRSDNPNADLFVRLCDVDPRGHSRNVADGLVRLGPDSVDAGASGAVAHAPVVLELDAIAHRFAPGHRLRLLVAGGAHPRFARNLGTGEPQATGTGLAVSHREIAHGEGGISRLLLPVASA